MRLPHKVVKQSFWKNTTVLFCEVSLMVPMCTRVGIIINGVRSHKHALKRTSGLQETTEL